MSISMSQLAGHARQLGQAAGEQQQWQVVSRLVAQAFGYRLFTALLYLEDQRLMKRLFSSDESISPLGGFKSTGSGPWSRHVLEQGLQYVASNEEDVATVFSEAPMLVARGLHSAFNMPVHHGGRVIGSLNLLDARHAYDAVDRELAHLIASLCAPVFLDAAESARSQVLDLDRSGLDSV